MKVSVIVPCYNVENRVRDCLDSLVHQTIGLEHLELILIDDASTDRTPEILKEYEKRYPENILVVLCDENGRQGTCRNIGLRYASGDWVGFVDADDEVHPEMFEILCRIGVESDSELVTFRYSSEQEILETDMTGKSESYQTYDIISIDERRKFVLRYDLINNSCTQKLYRRDLLERTGSDYAEGVCYEEPLFTYPLRYYVNRVTVTDLALYYYHLNPQGTINQTMSDPGTILDHLQVQLQLLDFMRSREVYGLYKNEIDLNFLHCFVYEPNRFLSGRGFEIPANVSRYIRKKVQELVPNWMENPYLPSIPQKEQEYIFRNLMG